MHELYMVTPERMKELNASSYVSCNSQVWKCRCL